MTPLESMRSVLYLDTIQMSHPIYQLAAEYVRVYLKGIGFDVHSCLHVFMPRVYDYCLQYLLYCLCVYAIRSMSYLSHVSILCMSYDLRRLTLN